MSFSPELADIRFGCGLAPDVSSPTSPEAMLKRLARPDQMATRYPVEQYSVYSDRLRRAFDFSMKRRKAKTVSEKSDFQQQVMAIAKQSRLDQAVWFGQVLSRWRHTPDGFRERLTLFWKDHFTALGKTGVMRQATQPYVEEAVRPHITGSFADLLIAVTTHPVMIHYLDQNVSAGPNSSVVLNKKRRNAGLNENLAREVLELHTLGVDGPYTQNDVRSLAMLFTGLTIEQGSQFKFAPWLAEPGSETVLGKSYGGDPAKLEHVHSVLRDLAVHPSTAAHIARKLAVHFSTDTPDPDLVAELTASFLGSGGDLMQLYEILLTHPAAWSPELTNVKPPFDFVASSCRALAIEGDQLFEKELRKSRFRLTNPLSVMGQPWLQPLGPNGWPEEDEAWITPQGLSARIRWAMSVPRLLGTDLPDPEAFVHTALGPYASHVVRFAAGAAETRAEAIGLVLSSPAFQRR